jgi:adenine-specific DNA-methyltransferase
MTSYSISNEIALDTSSYTEASTAKFPAFRSFDEISEQIASFPKTRYYGSKRRLLEWIHVALKDLPFNTVLDGFGGTASVSLLFKAMGKKVTFNDALISNTVAAKVLLAEKLCLELTEAYNFIDSIEPIEGFISNTFEGMYYTQKENNWLDGAASKIYDLEDELKRCIYLYSLFQACLMKRPFNLFHRANLNLRTNQNIKRSFGNYVTWETPFADLMKARLNDVLQSFTPSLHTPHILQNGDVTRLDAGYDLVYLDPPYVNQGNKSDDYLKRYHFLEGLSDYKNWKNNISPESKIKSFNKSLYISDWQSKSVFKDRLFSLIEKHNQSIVVLSYLANAYPTEQEITKCFESNFKHVTVERKDFCHALAKEKKVELLFVGSNK